MCHNFNRVPYERRIHTAPSVPPENTDPQSSGVSLQRRQTHWGIYYRQKEKLSIAMKASVTKNRNLFFSRTVFGIDQLFFIFQQHIRTFYHVYLLLKWTNKLLIQLLIPLINLSRMAVFANLQQENVYLFATVKASSSTESWCKKQLASGLKSRNLALLFCFFVPMSFLSPNFSVFLRLKIGNNYLQPKKYFKIRYSTLNLLFILSNFLTPEC